MKLVTNIRRVSGNCGKRFSRSEVKGSCVYKCVDAITAEACILTVYGVEVHLFKCVFRTNLFS